MRIEEGKFYLNRAGYSVGPMRRNEDGSMYFWRDQNGRPYFQNGRARVGLDPHPNDLMKEWIDPNAPAGNTATPPPVPPRYRDDSYSELVQVLQEAHAQASQGKGRDRHANGRSFDRQPIMEIGRMVGPSFAAGQAMKKTQEAIGMINRREDGAAVAELLGAINYLAACVMLVREHAA